MSEESNCNLEFIEPTPSNVFDFDPHLIVLRTPLIVPIIHQTIIKNNNIVVFLLVLGFSCKPWFRVYCFQYVKLLEFFPFF